MSKFETQKDQMSYVALLNDFNGKKSIIEILKVGKVHDRGLVITEQMLSDYVENFNNGVYGTEVQVNFSHNREGEAGGWITKLIKEGPVLLAEVEWTPLGIQKIKSKQFRFTSSELALKFPHHETGEKIKNVLIGVALTNVPAVKGMREVALSEGAAKYIHNLNNMKLLKELHATILASEVIEKDNIQKFDEEVEKVKAEASEEETKEVETMEKEVKEKVEEVETKEKADLEAEEAKKKEEEEEAEAQKATEEEAKKLSEKAPEMVSLSEYNKLKQENLNLKQSADKIQLSQEINNELLLSDDNLCGFAKEDLDEITAFMINLSADQRDEFKKLIGKVRTLDFSSKGSQNNAVRYNTKKVTPDAVVELAEQLLSEKKANNITEAQKMAATQLYKG